MASEQQYIDYATFTSPDFSPSAYANRLVLQTNNAQDATVDLSTPLSRVLFDVQEVDTLIDTLTTTHALPLITETKAQNEAGQRIVSEAERQIAELKESYARLERDVIERHEAAERSRLAAERMVATLRLGRNIQRGLQLAKRLDGHVGEGNMLPAARALVEFKQLAPGLEGVHLAKALREEVVSPAERSLLARAQQIVREFSMSNLVTASGQTFAQVEGTKARTTDALQALHFLSPKLVTTALQGYINTALTASLAALTRALATLPTLDKTLLEISARCQNVVALEALLESTSPPDSTSSSNNLLQPLLQHLDTQSLPSYFWRSMSDQMAPRVGEILARGGVSARTLRSSKAKVREAIRDCIHRGSRLPGDGAKEGGNWEREAAVMVGAIVGAIDRGR
ncbi:hypothetical protein K470DRAFT_213417 [Piedraia hortae CBS 480.64]|uniref:Conserved oligomeric Golgi complex subunit 5 n=1 Tax=Piedraia hortae CBS 480.64 TaxID=1314780 RepID=A0A6A7C675_9PEZI|nr:hypothetical protein K470DRAFT_213417 [Piedraia hortae CBS 480.64]